LPPIFGGWFRRWQTWVYLGLAIAALVLVLYGSLLVGWMVSLRNLLADPATQDFGLELLKAVISGVGTLATIIGGVAVFWNIVITREGQITDRFAEATRQLGDGDVAVCTGGIYALERIAKDSPRDHWVVMEVLASFVQAKSPRQFPTSEPIPLDSVPEEPEKSPLPEQLNQKITECIQAAIAVLGRRDTSIEQRWQRLSLRKTNLQAAYIVNANFDRADFFESNLYKAYIRYSRVRQAYFRRVNFAEAKIRDSSLLKSVFKNANLFRVDFRGSDLRGTNFTGANLMQANLKGVDLRGADLTGARLQQAHLQGADLRGAILRNAKLMGANLDGAKLHGANLEGTNLIDVQHLTAPQVHTTHHWHQVIGDRQSKETWGVPEKKHPPSED
jgi:uncharacterized protein YjbI with pentapeptide repeats